MSPQIGRRQHIVFIVIISSLALSLLIVLLNIETGRKIAYYESPHGTIERILNDSLEKDYSNTLHVHSIRLIAGIVAFTTFLGALGIYIRESKKLDEDYY